MPGFVSSARGLGGSGTGSTTVGALTTTSPNNVILAWVLTFGSGAAYAPVSSISDTVGLKWAPRSKYQVDLTGGGGSWTNIELWWALAPGLLTADVVTAVTGSDAGSTVVVIATAWVGVDINTPFDINGSLPAAASSIVNGTIPSVAAISTSNPATTIIAFNYSGSAFVGSPGLGYTLIPGSMVANATDGQYQSFSGQLSSVTVSFGPGDISNPYYAMTVDALRAAATSNLSSVFDYITEARVLLLDVVPPYRYLDSELIIGLNMALAEARKLRADLFLSQNPPGSIPRFLVNDGTLVSIDPQYSWPLVYYLCGNAQLRDEESTQDSRAMGFFKMFNQAMTAAT